MNTKNVSKIGITAAAVSVGLCAWSATTMAQTRIGRVGDRICLTSSPANLDVPTRTAGRVEMAVRPGAQKRKVERVVFSEMMFANNSDRLSDVGVGRSYLVAQKLKRGNNIRVVIQGHSRSSGSSALNHDLCLQRARRSSNSSRTSVSPRAVCRQSGSGMRRPASKPTGRARCMSVRSLRSKPKIVAPVPIRARNRLIRQRCSGPAKRVFSTRSLYRPLP